MNLKTLFISLHHSSLRPYLSYVKSDWAVFTASHPPSRALRIKIHFFAVSIWRFFYLNIGIKPFSATPYCHIMSPNAKITQSINSAWNIDFFFSCYLIYFVWLTFAEWFKQIVRRNVMEQHAHIAEIDLIEIWPICHGCSHVCQDFWLLLRLFGFVRSPLFSVPVLCRTRSVCRLLLFYSWFLAMDFGSVSFHINCFFRCSVVVRSTKKAIKSFYHSTHIRQFPFNSNAMVETEKRQFYHSLIASFFPMTMPEKRTKRQQKCLWFHI